MVRCMSVFHREIQARSMLGMLALVLIVIWSSPARAITLIRDPDIEYALGQLSAPILRAAGLSSDRVKVLVVKDGSMNAFIVSQDAIFVNSGLIERLKTPEMLQAIIAHEAAHIANGHLTRRMQNMRNARNIAGFGLALAAVAAASGAGEAASGIAAGTASSAQRVFLRHTRAEESSADQSAIRYLVSAGIPTSGMMDVFRLFRGQEVLAERRQDPYVRSHPFSRDRLRSVEAYVNANPDRAGSSAESDYWFARAKGKLSAFTRAPKWTMRRAKEGPTKDITLMRQAIAHHRNSNTKKALQHIDRAIQLRPRDPYLYELKGQILLESRNFNAAVATYGTAVKLAPRNALILGSYGRALLAIKRPKEAIAALEKSRARDFRDGRMLRDMAVAYATLGQNGMAALVTAERYALQGKLREAGRHAERASDLLNRGSAAWRRAQDVAAAAPKK